MSQNINGGGGSRNVLSSVDFYRRVPKDLTEVRTRHSSSSITCGRAIGGKELVLVPPQMRARRFLPAVVPQ